MINAEARVRPPVEQLTDCIERLATVLLRSGTASPSNPEDIASAQACRLVAKIESRKQGLFSGPDGIANDDARDVLLTRLDNEERPHLAAATQLVPTVPIAHAIRASCFQVVDAGGIYANAQAGSIHDALLAAIIHDLAAG